MTLRAWTISEAAGRPLTVNKVMSLHRQQWATHTREVRARWHLLALEAGVPALGAASFEVTPLHRDRRTPQDVAACVPEFKAALDGLVDAGVLPDDGGGFVRSVTFFPPRVCGVDGLQVTIVDEDGS